MKSLTKSSAAGMAWLLGQSGGGRLIGFLSQLLLAKLLQPSDFGDIALANSVATIIIALTGFGIDEVVLSRSRRLRMWLAPAFWASLVFSTVGAAVLLTAAPIAAHLYKSQTVLGLLHILAISVPLSALSSVPYICLRANLKFRLIASYATAELIGTQLLTIVLAWRGFGAYSFVVPLPLAALARAMVYWLMARPRTKFGLRRGQLKILLHNGAAVFGQKLTTSLRENGDYMILGLFAASSSVGLYYMAFRLAAAPVYMLVSSMSGVLFPAFAQLRGQPARQLSAALSASRAIAIAVIPLSFLQAAISGPLIHLFLGEKWQGSAAILSILSVGLAFDVVPCIAGSLLTANGRFRAQLNWALGSIPFFFLLIGTGCLAHGAQGVAIGLSVFFVISAPGYSFYAMKPFGATIRDVWGIYFPPVLCATCAIGLGVAVSKLPLIRDQDIAIIAVISAVGISSYVPLVRQASPTASRDATQKLSLIWNRS